MRKPSQRKRLFHVSPVGLRGRIEQGGLSGDKQLFETIECEQPLGVYGFESVECAVNWALNGDYSLHAGADLWSFEADESELAVDALIGESWYRPAGLGAVPAHWLGYVPGRDDLGLGPWVEGEEWNEAACAVCDALEARASAL